MSETTYEFVTTDGLRVVEAVQRGLTVEVARSAGYEGYPGDRRLVERVERWPAWEGTAGEWYVHLQGAGFKLGGPGSTLTWRVADE